MPRVSFKQLNRRWSKIPVSYRGGLILTIPAACIIAILIMWIELRKDAIVIHREIDRTESTIIEADNLLFLLTNAEIGVRGYTIAKQAIFLQPYQQAVIDAPNCLKKLKDLQQDTPQQQDVQQITKLVEGELDLLSQIIDRSQNRNIPEVRTLPNEDSRNSSNLINNLLVQSEQVSSERADAIDIFKSKQWQILNSRRQQLIQLRDITDLALFSAAIISLLSFLAALYLFKLLERELNNKQKSLRSRAKELVDLNHTLATTNNTLAERNHDLAQFSHIVSHDLKAPLRGIKNISEWLEEDLAEKLTEDTKNYLHLQRERIMRMENLIDGLLQYARVGKQNVVTEIVDVSKLIQAVIDSINPPPNFAIAIEGQMPIINTQSLFLEQVFSNLISNGIKHHPRLDGKITISFKEQASFYEFAVADDGAGIAPIAQKKIFDIFHTLKRGDSKLNTGVGLAIVKKIVEERGGKITVESEVGKGAVFRFQWAK